MEGTRVSAWLMLAALLVVVTGSACAQWIDPVWDGRTDLYPTLSELGPQFSFAMVGCIQAGPAGAQNRVLKNAHETLALAITELNMLESPPAFLVHLGDEVNVPNEASFENYVALVKPFLGKHIFVHGNHEGPPPYELFRRYGEQLTGHEAVYYSFNAGNWHFVVLPANLEFGKPAEADVITPMMAWLAQDLEANQERPTVVFEHIHLMPAGLSQLEWYTHSQAFKRQLVDSLARWGNVKYYFNAHVHNGIQPSIKTAWSYRGINFLTIPSVTVTRPFGEELSAFREGFERGGYYTVVTVNGDELTLHFRCAGVSAELVPDAAVFRPVEEVLEPKLFSRIIDLPAKSQLENGGFEQGLAGWHQTWRYACEGQSGFLTEARPKGQPDGSSGAYLFVMPLGRDWSNDEYNELYQVVEAPSGGPPFFRASYAIEQPAESGGGYFSLYGVGSGEGQEELKCLWFFAWGKPEDEYKADYYPRAVGYHTAGKVSSWTHLQDLGRQGKAVFVRLPSDPNLWHSVDANLAGLYEALSGEPGSYTQLGVTKFVLGAGVWSNMGISVGSEAFFDQIDLVAAPEDAPTLLDGTELSPGQLSRECQWGQGLADRVSGRKND